MNGDLDLSSEELDRLKAEGLIPPDCEPNQGDLMDAPGPLSEGNLLDSPGVPQPAPGDLMSRAPLSAEEFQPSVKGGMTCSRDTSGKRLPFRILRFSDSKTLLFAGFRLTIRHCREQGRGLRLQPIS